MNDSTTRPLNGPPRLALARGQGIGSRSWPAAAVGAVSLVLAALLSGCSILGNIMGFEKQLERVQEYGRIDGNVNTEHDNAGPLVVVLIRETPDGPDEYVAADTYVRVRPGSYAIPVAAGTYRVGAYEDRNRNGKYDPVESVARPLIADPVTLGPGDNITYDILIPTDGRVPGLTESIDVFGMVARTPEEQRTFSLWAWTVQGEICEDLDDPKFGAEAGAKGLWRIDDFMNDGVMGIYFTEPYDPDRIPVLFVHGVSGYPQGFSSLIDSLDRDRFQAWFYFYPSGFNLGFPPRSGISGHLSSLIERLQVKHGFSELAIVAHSMGGLISRGAILKYYERTQRSDIRLLISIATPWGGDANAARVGDSPVELPLCFSDMDPASDYQWWIFYEDKAKQSAKPLPPRVEFHLLFGFRKSDSSSVSDDGTVALSSALRMEAQLQARTQRGYDNGHAGILHNSDAVERVNQLLSDRFD
jgi:pimeloyl-ACP methyl ester carboxylesterase